MTYIILYCIALGAVVTTISLIFNYVKQDFKAFEANQAREKQEANQAEYSKAVEKIQHIENETTNSKNVVITKINKTLE